MSKKDDVFHHVETQIIQSLPKPICTEIGHAITRWTLVESVIRDTVYLTCDIRRDIGRLVIRQPRSDEAVQMIRDVLQMLEVEVVFDFPAFMNLLIEVRSLRDQIAHGRFMQDIRDDAISVEYTTGKWDVGFGKVKWTRRMRPALTATSPQYFKDLHKKTDLALDQAFTLHKLIFAALPPSLRRYPSPVLGDGPAGGQSGNTPPSPPAASPA